MNQFLCVLFLLLTKTQGYITYDSGLIIKDYQFDSSFYCRFGILYTYTYAFSGQFENTPQVFLQLESIGSSMNGQLMSFSILSITNTNFIIRISCPNQWLYRLNLKWQAYDDQRVEVISCFDCTTFGQQTISHKNPNALKGFPSAISFSYTAAFSFDITIDSITSTSVTFTITKSGGLVGIGFQILLITKERFSFVDRLQKNTDYTSNALPILNNFQLVVAYVGFNYLNTDHLIEYKSYILTDTTIQYKLLHNAVKIENIHYAAWIATTSTQDFYAMETSRINTAQYYDSDENRPFNIVRIKHVIQFFQFQLING